MKRFIAAILSILIGLIGLPQLAFADSATIQAADTFITFDYGSGGQGDVTIRLKNGSTVSGQIEVLKNQSVIATISGTIVVQRGDVLPDNRPNRTTVQVDFAQIAAVLGKTYAPVYNLSDVSNPTLSGVPEFRNFTLDADIKLTTLTNIPLAYKVSQKQTISGVLSAKWGEGGAVMVAGQNAQPVIIMAKQTEISPTGVIAPYGGGGGGAGSGYYRVGNGPYVGYAGVIGGTGGCTYLYTLTLVINGLITSGNGGGGGAGANDPNQTGSSGGSCGPAGSAGDIFVFAKDQTGTGTIFAGFNGEKTTIVHRGNSSPYPGGAGAGAGGSQYMYAGYNSYVNPCPGNPGNYVDQGTFTTDMRLIGGSGIVTTSYGKVLTATALTVGYACGNLNLFIENSDGNIKSGVGPSEVGASFNGNMAMHLGNISKIDLKTMMHKSLASGNAIFVSSPVTITYGMQETAQLTATMQLYSGGTIEKGIRLSGSLGNTGTQSVLFNGSTQYNLTIASPGEVRFRDNPSALNTGYWTGQTTTVNGIRVLRVQPAITTNDFGINTVTLDEWKTNYASGQNGSLLSQNMEFSVEKRDETESTWTRVAEVTKSLASNPSWKDMNTKVGQLTNYRVGYRNPGQTAYIYIEDCSISGKSEGGGGVDETAPTISFLKVAGGKKQVDASLQAVELIAVDNRTPQGSLKTRIIVNGKKYCYGPTGFKLSSVDTERGTYFSSANGLPLDEGLNQIMVEVYDEAGNRSVEVTEVTCITEQSTVLPVVLSTDLGPGQNTAVSITPQSGKQPMSAVVDGVTMWVVDDNALTITFDPTKLPGITGYSYSISGDSYGAAQKIGKVANVHLPPMSGKHVVKFLFYNAQGYASQEPVKLNILYDRTPPKASGFIVGKITVTKNSSVQVRVTVEDDATTNFEWSTDKTAWHVLSTDGVISLDLTSGRNNRTIYVRDSAGRIGSFDIYVYRI